MIKDPFFSFLSGQCPNFSNLLQFWIDLDHDFLTSNHQGWTRSQWLYRLNSSLWKWVVWSSSSSRRMTRWRVYQLYRCSLKSREILLGITYFLISEAFNFFECNYRGNGNVSPINLRLLAPSSKVRLLVLWTPINSFLELEKNLYKAQ